MEFNDNSPYTKLTLSNIYYAEQMGMLDKHKEEDGAPLTWKFMFGKHILSELTKANVEFIRRKDSTAHAWVHPDIYELIVQWTDHGYADLTLSEYLSKILN